VPYPSKINRYAFAPGPAASVDGYDLAWHTLRDAASYTLAVGLAMPVGGFVAANVSTTLRLILRP
jgi:hypothetical protein